MSCPDEVRRLIVERLETRAMLSAVLVGGVSDHADQGNRQGDGETIRHRRDRAADVLQHADRRDREHHQQGHHQPPFGHRGSPPVPTGALSFAAPMPTAAPPSRLPSAGAPSFGSPSFGSPTPGPSSTAPSLSQPLALVFVVSSPSGSSLVATPVAGEGTSGSPAATTAGVAVQSDSASDRVEPALQQLDSARVAARAVQPSDRAERISPRDPGIGAARESTGFDDSIPPDQPWNSGSIGNDASGFLVPGPASAADPLIDSHDAQPESWQISDATLRALHSLRFGSSAAQNQATDLAIADWFGKSTGLIELDMPAHPFPAPLLQAGLVDVLVDATVGLHRSIELATADGDINDAAVETLLENSWTGLAGEMQHLEPIPQRPAHQAQTATVVAMGVLAATARRRRLLKRQATRTSG